MRKIIVITAFIITLAVNILFEIPSVALFKDETINLMATKSISNFAITAFVILFMCFYYKRNLGFDLKNLKKSLLWLLPCVAVAIVNFPISALANGTAKIERKNIIWLFVLYSVSIGFAEELLFRGIVHNFTKDYFEKKKNGYLKSVIVSSAIFSLWHLTNLFFGAGFGATALQVGYTFLLGCMFACVYDYTKNIWYSVFLHSSFDIGGNIIAFVGTGDSWDAVFWILTAIFGVICGAHIVYTVLKTNKRFNEALPVSANDTDATPTSNFTKNETEKLANETPPVSANDETKPDNGKLADDNGNTDTDGNENKPENK